MHVLPLKRGCQGADCCPQARCCRDQRRHRTERGDTLAQTRDHRLEAVQIADALTFGAAVRSLPGSARLVRPHGVEEQARLAHHALADTARGMLIVFEPALQLPGRQRCRGQRCQQARGMLGVGARQQCVIARRSGAPGEASLRGTAVASPAS
jgi:hypothetical protein